MLQPINADINQLVADKLVRLRKANGYTSYENFALEHGLGRKYYWMVEKGKAKISFVCFVKLMKCLKIAPSRYQITVIDLTGKEIYNTSQNGSA